MNIIYDLLAMREEQILEIIVYTSYLSIQDEYNVKMLILSATSQLIRSGALAAMQIHSTDKYKADE